MKAILLLTTLISFSSFGQSIVYFNTGSYVPEAIEIKKLDAVVKEYISNGYNSVKITGYADTTSNWDFNLWLSQKRAKQVKQLLIEKGIPEEAILTTHKGESGAGKDLKLDRKAEIVLQKEVLSLKDMFKEQDVEKQYFSFDPSIDKDIKCSRGTVLQIPKDCFVDENGNPILSKVNMVVQEYYNLGDYAKMGLFTSAKRINSGTNNINNPSELLQSGGVIKVNATSKGKKIYFAPGMKMAIGFNSAADGGMNAFFGSEGIHGSDWFLDVLSKTPGKNQKGSDIWVKDSVLLYQTTEKGKTIHVDTTDKSFQTYRFIERRVPTVYVNNFGLINCDKFMNDPTAVEMQINAIPSLEASNPETMFYIIFQKTMSVLPMTRQTEQNRIQFCSPKMKMPKGSMAFIIGVSKKGKIFYFGSEALELNGDQTIDVNIRNSSMKEIKKVMAEFAMN